MKKIKLEKFLYCMDSLYFHAQAQGQIAVFPAFKKREEKKAQFDPACVN